MHYFHVQLNNVPRDQEDALTEFCFSHGASGISENLKFSQPDLVYEPVVIESPFLAMDVYFESIPDEQFQLEIFSRWPDIKYSISKEENRDWLEEWKKGFTSFCLFGPYWVIPSWLPTPPEAQRPILIDPGMAFGTGTHATTRLAAELVTRARRGRNFLDVGTGTAILAMVAVYEGYGRVVANDIDPIARDVARENLAHNKMASVEVTDLAIDAITEKFDVVCANIIDGVLIKLKADLLKSLAPKGELILSGILKEREDVFTREFLQDMNVIERVTQDEWVAFRVRVRVKEE